MGTSSRRADLCNCGIVGFFAVLTGMGCSSSSDGLPEIRLPLDAGADLSVSEEDAGSDVSEELDSSADGSDDSDGSGDADAGQGRVILGLWPNVRASYEGEASASAELEALAQGLSSGAQAFVDNGAWASLAPVSTGYSDGALGKLKQRATLLRDNGRDLYLRLSVIDGALDGRPSDLRNLAWANPSVRESAKTLIDRVYERTGSELHYLSLGSEVDLYLSLHSEQADAISQFFGELGSYAKAHPDAPSGIRIGVSLSSAGFLRADAPAWIDALGSTSEVVMLSHYAVNDAGMATSVSLVSEQMKALMDRAKGRPILFERISYPSSSLIGGGEDSQAQYLDGVLRYVGDHRGQFAFVGVHALHDSSPSECVQFAAMRGHAESTESYAYECSSGLRSRDDTAKAAFSVFLQGASMLMAPK